MLELKSNCRANRISQTAKKRDGVRLRLIPCKSQVHLLSRKHSPDPVCNFFKMQANEFTNCRTKETDVSFYFFMESNKAAMSSADAFEDKSSSD